MQTALKEGDSTAEEMFKTPAERTGEQVAEGTQAGVDALKNRYVKEPVNPQQPSPDQDQQPPTAEETTGTQGTTSSSSLQEATQAQENLNRKRGHNSPRQKGQGTFGDQDGGGN